MAVSLGGLLRGMRGKIDRLVLVQREKDEEIARLAKERDELLHEVDELRKELEKEKLNAEFLRMSHRLADNPDSIVETRRHIASLIRNIDRCIEQLSSGGLGNL